MKDRIFIDTNVLIYLYSEDEIEKQKISENLVNQYSPIISIQVINEICNVMIKKLNLDLQTVSDVISELSEYCIIKTITIETIRYAVKIVEKYKYSYYDSLIISSALENKCTKLYSEDMQHEQFIENQIKIINPFIK
jgi:predicted nucleic acid-binding protein